MKNNKRVAKLVALLCALVLLMTGCDWNMGAQTTEPTAPSTQPTEPSTQPTEPSTQPTEVPLEELVVDMADDAIASDRYRLPYVNAPGYENVNQEIRQQLLWQATELGWDDIGYTVSSREDVVSILVRCEGFSDDSAYYTFHFSRSTGQLLTRMDILALYDLTQAQFEELAKAQAVDYFNGLNGWMQEEHNDEYTQLLQETTEQTLDDTQVFIDVNGNLGFVAYIGIIAGSGHYDLPLSCWKDVPIVNVEFSQEQ